MRNEELVVEVPRSAAPAGLDKGQVVQLSNGMQASSFNATIVLLRCGATPCCGRTCWPGEAGQVVVQPSNGMRASYVPLREAPPWRCCRGSLGRRFA